MRGCRHFAGQPFVMLFYAEQLVVVEPLQEVRRTATANHNLVG